MLCNEEMRKGILSRLKGYRYPHSLGVERAAKWLAQQYGGDVEKAAERLGVSRATLYRRIKRYGIDLRGSRQ